MRCVDLGRRGSSRSSGVGFSRLCRLHLEIEDVSPGRGTPAHLLPQLEQLELLIVLQPLILIAEDLVGLLDLLELVLLLSLEGVVLHLVRVTLQHQLAVRAADLGKLSIFRDTEGQVRIGWEVEGHQHTTEPGAVVVGAGGG